MAEKTMGEKVLGFLAAAGLLPKQGPPLDPAVFGDPLATATQWTPLASGGSNFCTHRSKKIDQMRMEFKTTFGMKLFCFFFSAMGALFGVVPLWPIYKQYGGFHWTMFLNSLFGLAFCAAGIFMYYYSSQPIVFDRKMNCFFKGRTTPADSLSRKKVNFVELHRIRGLQVLSEYCSGSKSSYFSYELNLVLDDATRANVVDHGNIRALREDAKMLGQFLGVQVWDAEAARAEIRT
jgi:hypothetical protein